MGFRAIGLSPRDWDAEVFHYELRFAAAPTDEQLGQLGALYGQWFARGPAEPGGWVFADRFAYFSVAQRGEPRAIFTQVERFLRAADELVAIDEAIHTTANEDFGVLEPGPAHQPSARPVDASLPTPTLSEPFKRALARIHDGKRLAKIQKLVDGVKAKEPPLRLTVPTSPTPQEAYPAPLRSRFAGADGHFTGPVGRPSRQVIEVRTRDHFQPAGWVSLAEGRLALPAGRLVWPARVGLEPTGRWALIAVAPQIHDGPAGPVPGKGADAVWEADLAEPRAWPVWSCEPEGGALKHCAYLAAPTGDTTVFA